MTAFLIGLPITVSILVAIGATLSVYLAEQEKHG